MRFGRPTRLSERDYAVIQHIFRVVTPQYGLRRLVAREFNLSLSGVDFARKKSQLPVDSRGTYGSKA